MNNLQTVTTIANLKGGTGKTTTVMALSYGLVNKGFKVLAVDLDSQANLTRCFGKYQENGADFYDWLVENKDVRVKIVDGLDLIPATKKGSGSFNNDCRDNKISPSGYLKNQLCLYDDYDFVLIDVPSLCGYELTNAAVASNSALIPTPPDFLSTDGMEEMEDLIKNFKQYNPQLNLTGVFVNKVRTNTASHRVGMEKISKTLQNKGVSLYKNIVRESSLVETSQRDHFDFFKNISKNPAAQDYKEIINEYLEKVGR